MQVDRYVCLLQGGAVAPLWKGATRMDSLRSAYAHCERVHAERVAAAGEDRPALSPSLERKLFICLALNCDGIANKIGVTKSFPGSDPEKPLPLRNVTNLFKIKGDVLASVIEERKLHRFVIEAIVCLPKDDSARLLNFLHEWRVGGDNPWFLTAANLAGSCRLRDNDDFDDRDEFPIFNSNHASPEEDMAANLFVLKYCARGRFSECADALIGEEDRGDLERIYGEKCFDSREKKTEKRRSIMWKQFVLRASTRRRPLTVDDWLGFCEIPAADSLYSNGYLRLWPAGDPAPPENCQQLIAHLAHECAGAIRDAGCQAEEDISKHVDELAAFARKYEREHRLDMDRLGLDELSKRASGAGAAEWERECYLKAICEWTPFAELAESEAALRSVAEHPHISVRHFGRFRGKLLGEAAAEGQHHGNQALRDTFAALFAHCPPEEMRETVSRRLAALGAGEELESSRFQDTALQFMNRISMEEGGVSLDERTLASLLVQAPRKTLQLLVTDAAESAGKVAPVARLLAAGLTDLVRSEFGSVLREISCDVIASSAAAAGDDEERYGRLVQLAVGMGSSDRAGLAAPIVDWFYKVCLGSEILLTRTVPLFVDLATPECYTDPSSEEVAGLVSFLAQALNYLEAKAALKDVSAMESLVTVLSRFTTKSEPLSDLVLSSLGGHARFYFLRESSTVLQVLHAHFSTGGKLPSTNLRFGSTAEFVCALAEALPNLLPKELSALFSQFQCEFFDAPVTKLKAVIKALEVLLETGTVTANMTRAVADYFDAADVSAKDAVAICQEASGLLYLNPSGDNGATSAAVASLVTRLVDSAIAEKGAVDSGLARELAVTLVHAPHFESKEILARKIEALERLREE